LKKIINFGNKFQLRHAFDYFLMVENWKTNLDYTRYIYFNRAMRFLEGSLDTIAVAYKL
jgi:hypothetical protein